MTLQSAAVGAYGERVAAAHLHDLGMAILERNWRCAHGEVDIIARDGDALVFVEVKTRSGDAFGFPSESVVPGKVRRLRQLATQWLTSHGVRATEVRFDVISILHRRKGSARIHHLRHAF